MKICFTDANQNYTEQEISDEEFWKNLKFEKPEPITITCIRPHFEWISVKDRLPDNINEEDQPNYLVLLENGHANLMMWRFNREFQVYDDFCWHCNECMHSPITHWIYIKDIPKP